jgi:hypothetical protein
MAIDYVLATPCEPQRTLGMHRLVELHRTRILARAALTRMRESGDERPPSEISVQLMTRRPEGDSGRGITLQDMLDESAPLDAHTRHCATCPAGFTREIGCHRRIRYPIPEHVEAWLMTRLPHTLGCTAGALLVRGIADFGWDGAPAARLRSSGTTFFESRAPYGVRWQAEEDNAVIEISSDQLFQMMFLVGNLSATHCMMLALFCGLIPHDTPLAELADSTDRTRLLAIADLAPEADQDVEQLAGFLRTLVLAARLDATIAIDG